MLLSYPTCGAVHGADSWEKEAQIRRTFKIIVSMPTPIIPFTLDYVALFRTPGGRGVTWKRAGSILSSLKEEIDKGYIQRSHRPARDCSAAHWASGLDRIITTPPGRLPLKSHGYLMEIVYDFAEEASKAGERSRIEAERNGTIRNDRQATTDGLESFKPLDPSEMRRVYEEKRGRRKRPAP